MRRIRANLALVMIDNPLSFVISGARAIQTPLSHAISPRDNMPSLKDFC